MAEETRMPDHLDLDTIVEYVEMALSEEQARPVELHLARCDTCTELARDAQELAQAVVEELVGEAVGEAVEDDPALASRLHEAGTAELLEGIGGLVVVDPEGEGEVADAELGHRAEGEEHPEPGGVGQERHQRAEPLGLVDRQRLRAHRADALPVHRVVVVERCHIRIVARMSG